VCFALPDRSAASAPSFYFYVAWLIGHSKSDLSTHGLSNRTSKNPTCDAWMSSQPFFPSFAGNPFSNLLPWAITVIRRPAVEMPRACSHHRDGYVVPSASWCSNTNDDRTVPSPRFRSGLSCAVTFTLRVGKVRFQIFKTRALEAAGLSE
jgi:hypothetical protein